MWTRNFYDDRVDVQPRGEEDKHISMPECECEPRLSRYADDGRLMIIHKTFDGAAEFEPAAMSNAECGMRYAGLRRVA
jgi:hypothetical protein